VSVSKTRNPLVIKNLSGTPVVLEKDPHAVSVEPLDGLALRVTFDDGLERIVDIEPYLRGGLGEALRAPAMFRLAFVDPFGGVAWPNDFDIDPAVLYYNLRVAWMEDSQPLTR
jgi:hypothetical protein